MNNIYASNANMPRKTSEDKVFFAGSSVNTQSFPTNKDFKAPILSNSLTISQNKNIYNMKASQAGQRANVQFNNSSPPVSASPQPNLPVTFFQPNVPSNKTGYNISLSKTP